MSKKVCVIGHFAFGKNALNGQTVKTKVLTKELTRRYGQDEVTSLDTAKRWKTFFMCRRMLSRALKEHQNVVILPAQNGLRVIAPMLARMKKKYADRRLHYVVVGGWLPKFLQDRPKLTQALTHFDGIYVEMSTMQKALRDMGFQNVYVMPNCKPAPSMANTAPPPAHGEPYRLCTFSRVMKEKGIDCAVGAVTAVNAHMGREVFTLTVYGPVDKHQKGWFDALQRTFPSFVTYGGALPYDACRDTLAGYDALLFPTQYKAKGIPAEGIPGSIIDAYQAGLPVLASRWDGFDDMIAEGVTGFGFDMDEHATKALTDVLLQVARQPEQLRAMRKHCLTQAQKYQPSCVLDILCDQM